MGFMILSLLVFLCFPVQDVFSSTTCSKDTGGTCQITKCSHWRMAQCVGGKCVCKDDVCVHSGLCLQKYPAGPTPTKLHGIKLINWTMIMAHDAGTAHVHDETCTVQHEFNNYVVTQPKGKLSLQLDCGARALDLRPFFHEDGTLRIHHGAMEIDYMYDDAVKDVVQWANSNPGELVIIYATHCNNVVDTTNTTCQE